MVLQERVCIYLSTITNGLPISIISSCLKRWLFVSTQIIKWNITWRLEARFVFFDYQFCVLKFKRVKDENLEPVIWQRLILLLSNLFIRIDIITSFSSIDSADFSMQSKHCDMIGNTSRSTSTDLMKKFFIHLIRFSSRSWKFVSTDGESSV